MYKNVFKRIFDLIFSFISLLILFPFLLLVGFLIYLHMGNPVLVIQERPGLNGRIFKLLKFRTMNFNRDEMNKLLPDMKRITKLGWHLRRTSIDELPELINILKGEMSLVGPRPLLIRYLPYYTKEQARRHTVRPGLTGLAQIKGRNALNWEDKFKYDVWYVDHLSFMLDLRILLSTIQKVIRHEGINVDQTHTAISFDEEYRNRNNNLSTEQQITLK